MTYREPAPTTRPTTVYFDRAGIERPANGTDRFLHRVLCRVVNGDPVQLGRTGVGNANGFTTLCFCGLMWSGETP